MTFSGNFMPKRFGAGKDHDQKSAEASLAMPRGPRRTTTQKPKPNSKGHK